MMIRNETMCNIMCWYKVSYKKVFAPYWRNYMWIIIIIITNTKPGTLHGSEYNNFLYIFCAKWFWYLAQYINKWYYLASYYINTRQKKGNSRVPFRAYVCFWFIERVEMKFDLMHATLFGALYVLRQWFSV